MLSEYRKVAPVGLRKDQYRPHFIRNWRQLEAEPNKLDNVWVLLNRETTEDCHLGDHSLVLLHAQQFYRTIVSGLCSEAFECQRPGGVQEVLMNCASSAVEA